MTPEFLEAVLEGDLERASQVLDAELPGAFPHDGALRFFQLRLRQMRDDERFREWCPHAVVLDGRMIGHAGYHGPPGVNAKGNPDAIEIGYTIEEPWRGHGYATAAASELLRRAEERGITHYVACTAPDNEPSLAIIRKLGFQQTGEAIDEEDGLELVFELER
jgi:[ribosomal protein S5]-alanine N-acetyltransferase